MKERLLQLKKEIENIEITYDIASNYADLRNATIDFQNETQEWLFENVFDEYIDEWLLADMVKYKIDNEGLRSVQNLLSDISNYEGIYYVDVYGYGHDVEQEGIESIKCEILDIIDNKLESVKDEYNGNAS